MRALILYYLPYSWQEKGDEMHDLAAAAGYEIKSELEFRKIHKHNYITDSKYAELDYLVNEHKIKYLLVNEPVSVRYMRKLEEHFQSDEITFVDKTMLILEIFQKKSSSAEIQLQIKLAMIKYTEPRMRTVVGETLRTEKQARDRGAGETMQEIMKSDIRGRVAKYEKQIREISEVKKEDTDNSIPRIPIMGYYSVGKTTLFNILTNSDRETSQEAFTTMFMKSSWTTFTGYPMELLDTIGLVDLPPAVIEAFSLMLESIFSSDILMLAIDASGNEHQFTDQLRSLLKYYQKFASIRKKYKIIFVLTKCDLIDQEIYASRIETIDKEVEDVNLLELYETVGVRQDKPEYVRKSLTKIIDLLLDTELVSFEYEGLDQSETSRVYNHARITNEKWVNGLAKLQGIIPIDSFHKNLGILKEKLINCSIPEDIDLEFDEEEFDY